MAVAVAAAASQHLALSSVLRIPPLPSNRVSHTLARLSTSCPPRLFLSPTRPHSHVFRLRSLSLPRSRASSFSPHSRSSVSTCAPHNAFPSRLSPFGVYIFLCLFLFLPFTVALPLLMEKERKMKRMVEDPHASLSHRSSLLCSKCSPENPRDGESGRCETIAKYKWIRDKKERDRWIL